MKKLFSVLSICMFLLLLSCGDKEEPVKPDLNHKDGVYEITVNGTKNTIYQTNFGYDHELLYDAPADKNLTFYGMDALKSDSTFISKIPRGKMGIRIRYGMMDFGTVLYNLDGETYDILPSEPTETSYNDVESITYLGRKDKYAIFEFKGKFKGIFKGETSGKELPFSGTYKFKIGAWPK